MNLKDQYLDRAHEIIGERTPEEEKYDNEVLLWPEKTGKIRKAINKANTQMKHCNTTAITLQTSGNTTIIYFTI